MILNIHKPKGWTSFDVVKKVRHITKEKKVGHAGTLDPFAEGVLVLGTGKDTKSLSQISSSNKRYKAILKLGEKTDTLDTEGKIISKKAIPDLTDQDIHKVLISFLGKQKQIPPMFSAKKIDGTRLYKLARKNIEIDRPPVNIEIFFIRLIEFDNPYITFDVSCSKGTYIRVLGSDIAEKLETVGHLVELIRLKVGEYLIDDTVKIEELEEIWTS